MGKWLSARREQSVPAGSVGFVQQAFPPFLQPEKPQLFLSRKLQPSSYNDTRARSSCRTNGCEAVPCGRLVSVYGGRREEGMHI